MPSDNELVEAGKHVFCACMNAIPLEAVHCPYCKRFNNKTTSDNCPLCGKPFKEPEPEPEPIVE